MKSYFMIGMLALASCAGNGKKGADTVQMDSGKTDTAYASKTNTPAQNMEYCFVHTDGTAAQDTTAVHLVINANKVSGEMNWLPKEKDRRKGTLSGTLDGDKINAVWSFMQEGQTDTMTVAFKLSSQQLAQKPFTVDAKNGRQQLDNKADYTIIYNMDNCDKFRK
ncbi:hypothetical protein IDJ77_21680 [Mucilaginibacter sp. ZT4R22]|uniref:Lipoprotein n=1 Tax=Mucilaginibacter pankratovii TaxID=2772110 RepID=A0ABR7WYE1_9SPHI|nr:hypothetical protein [Mucilaginibacter pankratovii]MBD1366439.1 hypothetical protein [Mucilaginibacter pankratovii]